MPTDSLDPFQLEVIDFINHADTPGRAIYADPVGARKTGTTLSWLADNPDLKKALIVAPRAVHGHWFREALRFYPQLEVRTTRPGAAAETRRRLAILDAETPGHAAYITTYESMKADVEYLRRKGMFDTVIFDEGHRLKGRRTEVALSANLVTLRPECQVIATGTPVLNNADELWQYLHMLDRNKYPSFKRWVEEHFDVEYTSFHGKLARPVRVVGDMLPGHEQILRWQLAGVMIQREIGELFPGEAWVEEPEHIVIDVDLSAAERKAYDQLVKHQWVGLDNMTVTAANRLALSTRLQQLSSDWGTIDATLEAGTKVKAAAELIGDLARHETVVAFAKYQETCRRLADAVSAKGYNVALWTGDQSEEQHEATRRAYALGEVDVVVGTLASLGEGVDGFQYRGSSIVMLDRGWTPASNDQPIGRRRRSGQTRRVFVYHVMGRNTIDATVVAACLRKENVTSLIADRPLKDTIYGTGVTL